MVTKSITVDGIKIDLPKEMQVSGGQFEISKEGYDPVIIDLDKSVEFVDPVTAGALGALLGASIGTVINKLRSIGTFTTYDEAFKAAEGQSRHKLGGRTPATLKELENSALYKSWGNFKYKEVNKMAMCIAKPVLSADLQQLANKKVHVIFAFYKNPNGTIRAKETGVCYMQV